MNHDAKFLPNGYLLPVDRSLVTGPDEADYKAEDKALSEEQRKDIRAAKEEMRAVMLGIDARRKRLMALPQGPAVAGAVECMNNALHELQTAVSQLVGL